MHENNRDGNPHAEHDMPTKRAKITLSFDVPREEATQAFLDAIIGSIRQDLKSDKDFRGMSVTVFGRWG